MGQLKIEIAKAEKMHRPTPTGHTERFIFHSVWFINASNNFKIFETRLQCPLAIVVWKLLELSLSSILALPYLVNKN